MTRVRIPVTAAVAAAVLLVVGCARPADDAAVDRSGAGPGAAAPDGDAVVLRVRQEGGFVPPELVVGRIPDVSVYADGRMITPGPVITVYPGPAWPNLQVQQLDAAAVGKLLDDAVAAGVRSGADLGSPGVTDAPATRVEVTRDGATAAVSAMALREAVADDPLLTADQRAGRARLTAFLDRLDAMATAPGQQPYRAETVAALASAYNRPDDGLPKQSGVAWPGPALPGEYLNQNVKIGCVAAAGAERDAIIAAARDANQNTPWRSGAEQYTVTFRPLLPDEAGCADLKAAR